MDILKGRIKGHMLWLVSYYLHGLSNMCVLPSNMT